MSAQLAGYCLKEMGIEIWRNVYPLPGSRQTVDCHCYRLIRRSNNETVGNLLLQAMTVNSPELQKIQRLVEAMLFAVGLRAEVQHDPLSSNGIMLIWGLSLAQKILQSAQPLAALQQLASQTTTGVPLAIGYHPLELLQQPLLKAAAWQDIKKIFP